MSDKVVILTGGCHATSSFYLNVSVSVLQKLRSYRLGSPNTLVVAYSNDPSQC